MLVTLEVWTKFRAGVNWWFSPVKLMTIEAASGCLSVYVAPLSPRLLPWLNPSPIQPRNIFFFFSYLRFHRPFIFNISTKGKQSPRRKIRVSVLLRHWSHTSLNEEEQQDG